MSVRPVQNWVKVSWQIRHVLEKETRQQLWEKTLSGVRATTHKAENILVGYYIRFNFLPQAEVNHISLLFFATSLRTPTLRRAPEQRCGRIMRQKYASDARVLALYRKGESTEHWPRWKVLGNISKWARVAKKKQNNPLLNEECGAREQQLKSPMHLKVQELSGADGCISTGQLPSTSESTMKKKVHSCHLQNMTGKQAITKLATKSRLSKLQPQQQPTHLTNR